MRTMKSERIELAALAKAHGPMLNTREIETAQYLAEFAEVCKRIDDTPVEIRMERVHAVRAGLVRPADAEAVRAAFWLRAPLAARMVACLAAKLPKERASDALCKFNAFERGTMWVALNKLIGELQMLQKCAQGGAMPSPSDKDMH
jgi:hypothetical protein